MKKTHIFLETLLTVEGLPDYIPQQRERRAAWRRITSLSCYPRNWHISACFD